MFTNIVVENFKSITRGEFKLSNAINTDKPVLIFGKSGTGKTNFAETFVCLNTLMKTMDIKKVVDNLCFSGSLCYDTISQISSKIKHGNAAIFRAEDLYREYKSPFGQEDILLQFNFVLEKTGTYTVRLNKNGIVYEKLQYALESNKVTLFEIGEYREKINVKLFGSHAYDYIYKLSREYWGAHSLLAIIDYSLSDLSANAIKGIDKQLLNVLNSFKSIAYKTENKKSTPYPDILFNLYSGRITKTNQEDILKKVAYDLTGIFNSLFPHKNVDVSYIFKEDDEYQMIIRSDFNMDMNKLPSSYKQIIDILPYFYTILNKKNGTIVLDNADEISEVLFNNLLCCYRFKTCPQIILLTNKNSDVFANISFLHDSQYRLLATRKNRLVFNSYNSLDEVQNIENTNHLSSAFIDNSKFLKGGFLL